MCHFIRGREGGCRGTPHLSVNPMSYRIIWLLALAAGSSGCGPDYSQTADVERSVNVSGVLTYQGQPLEHYQVVLMPTDGRRVATGVTDAEGRFVMGTNKAGDGAPPGPSKVAVYFTGPPATDAPGNEQIIDDPSQLPQPKVKIPEKYGDPAQSGLTQDVPDSGLKDWKLELQ